MKRLHDHVAGAVIGICMAAALIAVAPHTPQPSTLPESFLKGVEQDKARSGKWHAVRAKHLAAHPYCAYCGGTEKLQVHHIKPFHLNPELHGSTEPGGELDPENLITLCEAPGKNCHLKIGHGGNFKGENPNVVEDCKQHRKAEGIKDESFLDTRRKNAWLLWRLSGNDLERMHA